MGNDYSVPELEMRRKIVMHALGIRLKDLRAVLGFKFKGPKLSFVFRGERDLTPKEIDKLLPLVVERLRGLFS